MYIIIPAYEPDHRLPNLVTDLQHSTELNAEIIIVNDGSDASYDQFYQAGVDLGAILLTHDQNRGKGAALKTAFSYLSDLASNEVIVTVDSDGQHLIPDIIKVANRVQAEERELVLGSRAFVGQVPFRSRFGNKVTAGLFGLVTGQKVSDTQTGLRAFSADLLPWLLSLDGDRFEYEFNMLLEAKRAGVTLVEEPIETVYLDENKSSHFRPLQDSARIYAPFLKFIFSASAAALVDIIFLMLLMTVTKNLLLSVVLARVFSSLVQYLLNANLVFKQSSHRFRSLIRYAGLVITLLACNYFLLQGLVNLGLGLLLAKCLTEGLLFLASYRLQQTVVFA